MVTIQHSQKKMKPRQSEASSGLKSNLSCRKTQSYNRALAPFMLNYQVGVGWFVDQTNDFNTL